MIIKRYTKNLKEIQKLWDVKEGTDSSVKITKTGPVIRSALAISDDHGYDIHNVFMEFQWKQGIVILSFDSNYQKEVNNDELFNWDSWVQILKEKPQDPISFLRHHYFHVNLGKMRDSNLEISEIIKMFEDYMWDITQPMQLVIQFGFDFEVVMEHSYASFKELEAGQLLSKVVEKLPNNLIATGDTEELLGASITGCITSVAPSIPLGYNCVIQTLTSLD